MHVTSLTKPLQTMYTVLWTNGTRVTSTRVTRHGATLRSYSLLLLQAAIRLPFSILFNPTRQSPMNSSAFQTGSSKKPGSVKNSRGQSQRIPKICSRLGTMVYHSTLAYLEVESTRSTWTTQLGKRRTSTFCSEHLFVHKEIWL